MKDEIVAEHGALVVSKPPPSEIMLRTQRRKKSGVKVGSSAVMSMKSQKRGTGFGSTKSNVLFSGQMLRYEKRQPNPDERKIRNLMNYIKGKLTHPPKE